VLLLVECPADLRPSLGRFITALGRGYRVKVIDYREVPADKRLAELVKTTEQDTERP
jgi:hypothetical protein